MILHVKSPVECHVWTVETIGLYAFRVIVVTMAPSSEERKSLFHNATMAAVGERLPCATTRHAGIGLHVVQKVFHWFHHGVCKGMVRLAAASNLLGELRTLVVDACSPRMAPMGATDPMSKTAEHTHKKEIG